MQKLVWTDGALLVNQKFFTHSLMPTVCSPYSPLEKYSESRNVTIFGCIKTVNLHLFII